MSVPAQSSDEQILGQTPKPVQNNPVPLILARATIWPGTLVRFRPWYWLAIPALAVIAYITVLRIGFLGDDFVLAAQADSSTGDGWLLPEQGSFLYRPLGLFLIWKLGIALWGFNPLPFHVQGLLLHAAVSLVLGLWVAQISSRSSLGWLAGAFFAVFPLPIEAVGWIAAQWDVLSTLFGLLSLWFFTAWWQLINTPDQPQENQSARRNISWFRRCYYPLAVLFYLLALFTKDSLLSFFPVLPLSAWLVTHRFTEVKWSRLLVGLVPFLGVLALNLSLRYLAWGSFGGYPGVRTDYPNFFFDAAIAETRILLAPINPTVLGDATAQIVGAISLCALLVGLVLYGRRWWRLLLVSGAWFVLTLAPVLNLPLNPANLAQNRVLYLPMVGYCVVVAVLLYSAIRAASRSGPKRLILAISGLITLLLLFTVVTWVQLRPWHTASVQSMDLERELTRLIPPPPQPRHDVMTWYVEELPHDYKGAYLPHLALGMARYFIGNGDTPATRGVTSARGIAPATEPINSFALKIGYGPNDQRYHVTYASGVTASSPAPTTTESGDWLSVWDFTSCTAGVLKAWQAYNTQASCYSGPTNGLILRQSTSDPQLISPPLYLQPVADGARFVRIRVSIRYPISDTRDAAVPMVSEWFWQGANQGWSAEQSQDMRVSLTGTPEVYWTFLPAQQVGPLVTQLRFDPVDSSLSTAIQWIAVDLVK